MTDLEVPRIRKLDEVVVNRIAAGEVIQRPANAIKEMLENSLDAKSTSVQITVKSGGLKLIQIQDDGCGIRKEDLGIVCERFTTSKLSNFEDLKSISTYGFRGEALASITHVAHVSIVTKTNDAKCAYKAKYADGKLVPGMPGQSSDPKPCAGNKGTQVTVEDLFYNVAIRRKALKNPTEEHNRIFDVVSKYAIHNAGVSFTFKKFGDSIADLRTALNATVLDNIQTVYGTTVANELLSFTHDDTKLGFEVKGHISNANYSMKKCIFILFINNRLVDSSSLKKAIEAVYSNYLPKDKHPFVYLGLKINPLNVDVNVHPTKHEVHFLHEDLIISSIQQSVETKLLGANESRYYYTQTLIPTLTSGSKTDEGTKKAGETDTSKNDAKVYAHHMVRTDSKSRKLDEFLGPSSSVNRKSAPSTTETIEDDGKQHSTTNDDAGACSVDKDQSEQDKDLAGKDTKAAKRKREGNENYSDVTAASYPWREIRLTSVQNLRKAAEDQGDGALKDLLKNHTFVGCVDKALALIQHQTKLYLVNTARISQELFYQLFLHRFGNFGYLRLSTPASIKSLVLIALNSEDSGWSQADGPKEDLACYAEKLLGEKAPMLLDYFSMEIDENDNLTALPMIIDNYSPDLTGLPMFILRLATEVDWNSEEECFRTFATECSKFYSTIPNTDTFVNDAQGEDNNNNAGEFEEPKSESHWKWIVEYVIFSNVRNNFCPTKDFLEDGTFLEVANLPDLYKVFERC